jgi:alkyldihydroxyacetonephosphate synthase
MFSKRPPAPAPPWYEALPPARSFRSILKWGAPDRHKHPNARLMAHIKDALGMTDEDFRSRHEVGDEPVPGELPGGLSETQLAQLASMVGAENIKTDSYSRLKVAYGKTMADLIRLRKGIVENLPAAVVCPRSRDDVRALVRHCHEARLPITVFGGGTSVTRGVECTRGGISLDMRVHMRKVLELNRVNQTVTVEPGIYGPALEEALNRAPERFGAKHRYTCGHYPQSFEESTVGGWVVTRGAGQGSTYYGKIEQMVRAQHYITPAGELRTEPYPACSMGPDVDQLMIGSEGAYGILVAVTLQIFRHRPESRAYFSYIFPSWERAVDAARETLQAEVGRPSTFRLSDPEETQVGLKHYGVEGTLLDTAMRMRGYRPGERCLLIGAADGYPTRSALVKRQVGRIARAHGAMSTTGWVTRLWEKGRYADPYLRDDLHDYGVILDTLECAAPWDRVMQVWRAVRDYCKARPRTVCMTHMSHVYPQGTNLYFIFAARMTELEDYLTFQAGILDTIRQSGAALSHHHGIGKMIAPWLPGALGDEQLALLRAIKRHLDPHNIMNPGGTLALDLPKSEQR